MFIALPVDEFEAITAGSPELVSRNNHKFIGFDAAAIESIVLSFRMPDDYATGSDVTGKVTMVAASATTGNVRVRLEFERIADGAFDVDADGFATAVEANAAADGTSGETFNASFTLSNANLDGVQPGELMRVKVSRIGNDGTNDTMTGDAQFKDLVLSQ
jgi:hypothetical protein